MHLELKEVKSFFTECLFETEHTLSKVCKLERVRVTETKRDGQTGRNIEQSRACSDVR